MTRKEFEQRVKDEDLRMESYCIEWNEYREDIMLWDAYKKMVNG